MNKTRKIRNKSEVTTASVECEYMLKENNKSWKERKITLNSPNHCLPNILIYCVDFQKSPSSYLIWRGMKPLASFVARLATSQPKKLAPLARGQLVASLFTVLKYSVLGGKTNLLYFVIIGLYSRRMSNVCVYARLATSQTEDFFGKSMLT